MTAQHETKHGVLLSEGTWVTTEIAHQADCLEHPCERCITIPILYMKNINQSSERVTNLPQMLQYVNEGPGV